MKPERIQMGLLQLPGWQHDERSEALVRHYQFPSSRAAGSYALYLSEMGEAHGFYPRIEIQHDTVTLVVPGGEDGLTDDHFEHARRLTLPV